MEDFYYAGGVAAVVRELGDLIHRDALTVNGKTLGENTADAPCYNRDVIKPFDEPLVEDEQGFPSFTKTGTATRLGDVWDYKSTTIE